MVQIKELTRGMDLKNKHFFIGTFKNGEHIRSNYISAEKLLKDGIGGIDENYDYYISVNTFRFKGKRDIQRSEDYIVSKNFVYIDLDFKTQEESLNFFYNELYKLPLEPNFVTLSGRGIWLFYRIADSNNISKKKWRELQRGVFNKIKAKYQVADSKVVDLARYTRLVGSTNSKSGNISQIKILNDYNYTSNAIATSYSIDLVQRQLKITSKPKVIKLVAKHEKYRNNFSLNNARLGDLKHLIHLRSASIEGHRNTLLHIASTCMYNLDNSLSEEELYNKLEELNNSFLEPIKSSELRAMTRSVIAKKYKYTNAKIIEKLDITEEEQRQLQTIISKEEADNRQRERSRLYRENKRRANGIMTIEERREKEQLKLMTDIQAIKKALDIGVSLSANKRLSEITRLDIRRIKYIKTKYKDSLQN